MVDTWECIVWDGSQWVRFPECVFMTAKSALDAAKRITCVRAVNVVATRDLNERGLPTVPPAEMHR